MSGYEIFKIESDRTQTDEEIKKALDEQSKKYREWLEKNQDGFVLNVDETQSTKNYPKLHKASCSYIGGQVNNNKKPDTKNYIAYDYKKKNLTYFKVCAHNVYELEDYSRKNYHPNKENDKPRQPLYACLRCNPDYTPSKYSNPLNFQATSQQSLENDLNELNQRLQKATTEAAQTEIQTLITARKGQGKFREGVLELYPQCPISGVDMSELLIASHIKPWRDCDDKEQLDPHNGLMLAPHIDALFDSGLITFEPDGKIRICKKVSAENLARLGISADTRLAIQPESEKYFAWHRENVFLKA